MRFNSIGLENSFGLDCFNGYSIWCHYKLEDDILIDKYIDSYKFPVIAIPEESGVLFDGNDIEVYGYKLCYLFDGRKKEMILPEN